jgi:TolB-like protein
LALPDRPSIAVLPFNNMSGDPDQEYFADGLTGDVITQLARFRSLFVIGSTSSFAYKDQTPKVQDVGRELGVAYVIQGSVRKAGNRVRITVELVEVASGRQLWAERYDRDLADIFAVQDEVAGKVVATLAGQIEDTSRRRAAAKRSADLAAYELVLLGEHAEKEFTEDGVLRARALFHQAIERDPENARAHASMARSYLDELWSDWSADWDAAAAQALAWAQKAVALDELDNRARTNLGEAYNLAKGNFEAAQAQFAKALELNPNDADAYCLRGWCYVYAGEGEEAIACTDRAMRLSPFDLEACLNAQFAAHYLARRYAEALAALARIPDPSVGNEAFRAACYAQLGRDDDARQAMETFMSEGPEEFTDWPGEDPEAWRRYWTRQIPFRVPGNLEHLLDGFRGAGMPI